MRPETFHYYYKAWRERIEAEARRCARGDLDFADDLAQEAFWKLSELDLNRVTTNEDAFIWRVLRDHMLMLRRSERRARMIGGSRPRRRTSRATRTQRRYCISKRVRRRLIKGPRHYNAAPVDLEAYLELWDTM